MNLPDLFLAGVSVGLVGGLTSGMLGVSPGGGLVIFSALLLAAEQHVAQSLSLFAQIPPTSLSGIRRYWESGSRSPWKWLVWLTAGFLVGGVAGALAAGAVSDSFLRRTYVVYLVALDAVMIFKPPVRDAETMVDGASQPIHWAALLAVGAIAGFSSGFLGIGGGLAITVGLSAGLKAPQRQAQMVSLILSIVPTTIPAAYVYWRQGWSPPWLAFCGVILGLWLGTDFGALIANRVSDAALRRTLIAFVSAMAIIMAVKAFA